MNERKIFLTEDGSHTITVPSGNLSFHSVYGAVQESMHVFIDCGLRTIIHSEKIRVFEMGFGTGLNALLTLICISTEKKSIYYKTIDAYPLEKNLSDQLNYCEMLERRDMRPVFQQLHNAAWEKDISITQDFVLHKTQSDIVKYNSQEEFDIIYFDAFDPVAQPELWTTDIFMKMWKMLSQGGILLTYCSKGTVRRTMEESGFSVEKLPGPKGKREIVRARKRI